MNVKMLLRVCLLLVLFQLPLYIWPSALPSNNDPQTKAYELLSNADKLLGTKNQTAKQYLDSVSTIIENNHNPDLNAEYNYLLGYLTFTNSEFSNAIDLIFKAYSYYINTNNQKRIADCNYVMGLCHIYNSNPKQGIAELFTAANIYDSLNLQKQFIETQNSIGSGFYHMKEFSKARDFFEQVKQYADINHDTLQLLTSLNNLGIINDEISGRGNALAMNYYRQAIEICTKQNLESELVSLYLNLGLDYFIKNNSDSAFILYQKAKSLAIKYNSLDALLVINVNLGEYYLRMQKFDSAMMLVDNASAIQDDLGSKIWTKDLLLLKAKIYHTKGEHVKAYEALEESMIWQDSLYNEQILRTVTEIEAQFESQKKIELLEQQKTIIETQRNRNRTLLAAIVLLVLLVILVLYYAMRFISINQKLNEKNKIINKTNQELQETIHTRDKLTSIIAHDIKNPLNTITGFAELSLTTKVDNVERYKLFSEQILKSSLNLNELLDNLLDWAKSQSQGIKAIAVDFAIDETIKTNMVLLHYMSLEKNIRLQIEVNQKHTVRADKQMINTVFRNLMTNAIKYTNRDGLIKIVSSESDGYIRIDVKDNGIGISEENIAKLFDAKAERDKLSEASNPGTGLGLLLCNDFIRLNGGYIEVFSAIGQGSCFSVFIPKAEGK